MKSAPISAKGEKFLEVCWLTSSVLFGVEADIVSGGESVCCACH